MSPEEAARVIATLPPYVDHRRDIIAHPRVGELRFNTISPLAESRRDMLARLKRECGGKRLWIDLKGRQLRIARFAYLPYAYVTLCHKIRVTLPVEVHFRDCVSQCVEIAGGDKLILSRRPLRVVGEGEPVNILHPSLTIEGTLTDSDREYIEAARELGLHDYMLSFAETGADVAEVRALDPLANVVAKIESRRGLERARGGGFALPGCAGLMAARDDLFVHVGAKPSAYLAALEDVIEADPGAVAASGLFASLERGDRVAPADLADLWCLLRMGYRRLMLGDAVCFQEDAFRRALALLDELLESAGG